MRKVFVVLLCGWAICANSMLFAATNYYVSPIGNDANSGTTWATAKQTIQAGVNCTIAGDTVLVTNGTYVLTNQVTVTNSITIRSVNGPTGTIVNGNGQVTFSRCFYLSANVILDGLTITNGFAISADGGGVYATSSCAVMTNCVLTGNTADNNGGGAYGSTMNNCTLIGNVGGGSGCSLYNSIVYYNSGHDVTSLF